MWNATLFVVYTSSFWCPKLVYTSERACRFRVSFFPFNLPAAAKEQSACYSAERMGMPSRKLGTLHTSSIAPLASFPDCLEVYVNFHRTKYRSYPETVFLYLAEIRRTSTTLPNIDETNSGAETSPPSLWIYVANVAPAKATQASTLPGWEDTSKVKGLAKRASSGALTSLTSTNNHH